MRLPLAKFRARHAMVSRIDPTQGVVLLGSGCELISRQGRDARGCGAALDQRSANTVCQGLHVLTAVSTLSCGSATNQLRDAGSPAPGT